MNRIIWTVVPIIVLFKVGGLLNAAAAERLPVFVSIPPQKYFLERIGGDRVDVSVLIGTGADPHHYEPRPRQMVKLAGTKAYFTVGVAVENIWLDKITDINPDMVIVHTDKGIEKRPMQALRFTEGESGHGMGENSKEEEHHKHEHRAHLDHGILDPHIWTSPPLVLIQAENILQGLIGIDRAHRAYYESRYRDFAEEIQSLHRELKRIFINRKGTRFMVWHPAWGYFAQTYGLVQIPIEAEGKEPKPNQLRYLIELGKALQLKVIFAQPQLSTRSARMIAKAVGAELVLIDPLAQDWGKNMRAIAQAFDRALK